MLNDTDKNELISLYKDKKRKVSTEKNDYIVSTIIEKIRQRDIILDPEYQRNFVWKRDKCSQLIESILLGIPLPTIYLSEGEEYDEVIDGQQRLTTIKSFTEGRYPNGEVFVLKGLKELNFLNGLSYLDLPKIFVKSLNDFNMTVIKIKKTDGENEESTYSTKFDIFERLNKGSENLKEQELRNCVYRGQFNVMLKKLADSDKIKRFFDSEELEKLKLRMDMHEAICSAFAAYQNQGIFIDSNIKKKALNNTMERLNKNQKEREDSIDGFVRSLDIIFHVFGKDAFNRKTKGKNKFNASIFLTMTSFFSQFEKNQVIGNSDKIRESFELIKDFDEDFINTLNRHTTGKQNMERRYSIIRDNMIDFIDGEEPRFFNNKVKKTLFEQDPTCKICGNKILNIGDSQVDHVIPFSRGGKTNIDNAQISHSYCNQRKG